MHPTLLLLLLVASFLLQDRASADCEPAACGTLTLRYPFWLGSGNQTSSPCGHPAFEVWCSDGRGVASLKGSSIHVLAIDYANSSFLASHSRVAAGDDGVCRADFNMSISIALSPFTISPRNRALCFLSKCDGTAPSGDEFVNATSNCSAPIYAYLGGTYYWDRPPAIATGRCTYSYIPVLGREAAPMTAANYSRLLKDGFVLEWEAGRRRWRLPGLQRERRAVPVRQRRRGVPVPLPRRQARGGAEMRRSAAEVEVEGQQQEEEKLKIWEEGSQEERKAAQGAERARDAEALMAEVFDAVSGLRRAYAALQGAHCPWDPDKMRAADAAVVAELRHLARLRDRFRRSAAAGHIPRPNPSAPPLCEAVAPYEATLDDLQRQLESKQAEVDGLKEKLAAPTSRRNGRHHPSKLNGPGGAPTADLFTTCAEQARAATRAFAAHLLHLGRCSTRCAPLTRWGSCLPSPASRSQRLRRNVLVCCGL